MRKWTSREGKRGPATPLANFPAEGGEHAVWPVRKRTLDVAQSLYEEWKLISYPRTDARYLGRETRIW